MQKRRIPSHCALCGCKLNIRRENYAWTSDLVKSFGEHAGGATFCVRTNNRCDTEYQHLVAIERYLTAHR